jgi:multiple sugar transport system substrate-binding protein
MKKWKEKAVFIPILAILLILAPSLWASGQEETSEEGGVLTVNFWTAPNQGQFDFWNDKVNLFNQSGVTLDGKTIQVALQMMPETPSSEAGIQNALATGTAPAASTNINRGFAAILSSSGRIYDLKNEEFFNSIIDSRKMSGVLQGWEIDGGQYVIPLYANAMGYHWNVKALKALGFSDSVPETVDDMKNLIATFYSQKETVMKDMGVSHLYMRPQLMHPEWWWDRWFDFQMQYEAFSGGKNWVTGNSLTMDKKTATEVFEFFGMFGSTLQTAEDWTAFEQDNVPVVFQVTAPWDIPKYNAAGKEYGFDGDYVYGPAIVKKKGDTPYTFADSKGIVFYKGGNITDEEHMGVVEFVKWCFTGEQGSKTDVEWVKTTGMLPVRGDLLDNAAFQEIIASNPAYTYLAQVMSYAIPAMAHDKMVDIQTALGEKGLTPYIQTVFDSTSVTAPDASSYIDTAFDAMIKSGELD